MSGRRVDWEEFVRVWIQVYNDGGKTTDVAAILGISPRTVIDRASVLRKKGVNLPKLASYTAVKPSDIDNFNSMLRTGISEMMIESRKKLGRRQK